MSAQQKLTIQNETIARLRGQIEELQRELLKAETKAAVYAEWAAAEAASQHPNLQLSFDTDPPARSLTDITRDAMRQLGRFNKTLLAQEVSRISGTEMQPHQMETYIGRAKNAGMIKKIRDSIGNTSQAIYQFTSDSKAA